MPPSLPAALGGHPWHQSPQKEDELLALVVPKAQLKRESWREQIHGNVSEILLNPPEHS